MKIQFGREIPHNTMKAIEFLQPVQSVISDQKVAWAELLERLLPDTKEPDHVVRQSFDQSMLSQETISIDSQCKLIVVSRGDHTQVCYSFAHLTEIQKAIQDGYRLNHHWLFTNKQVSVACMSKQTEVTSSAHTFMLMFFDRASKSILGTHTVSTSTGMKRVSELDMFTCTLSNDKKKLAFVLGLTPESQFQEVPFISCVHLYNVPDWKPIRMFQSDACLPPAVAFRDNSNQLAVVGLCPDEATSPEISIISTDSGSYLVRKQLQLFDMDGESFVQLQYILDGQYILLQVFEMANMPGSFLNTSYILTADTLQLLWRCKPAMAHVTNDAIIPSVHVISTSQDTLALVHHVTKRSLRIDTYIVTNSSAE